MTPSRPSQPLPPVAYSHAAPAWPTPQPLPVAPGPTFAPQFGPTNPAEQAALVRPWQVTFYGWTAIIGSVACLLVVLPMMFVNDATVIQWWTDLDSQAEITVEGLNTARMIIIVADVLLAVIVGINLPAGVALLRGSRGAYLYFVTMLWINVIGVILMMLLVVLMSVIVSSAI